MIEVLTLIPADVVGTVSPLRFIWHLTHCIGVCFAATKPVVVIWPFPRRTNLDQVSHN